MIKITKKGNHFLLHLQYHQQTYVHIWQTCKYILYKNRRNQMCISIISQDRLHAPLQNERLNFSGLYRGRGATDSCRGMIFRLQDKNSLTLTGKSIFALSPNSSTIMSHWFGKWHLEKSSFSRRMCPLSLLFFPLFLKRKLKCVCLKEMTVGSELLDLRCSKIPQCRASVAS